MSERDAFLHTIRANPEDDTLRLVFADWLEDHAEPEYAEFIRIQCELEPQRFEIDRPRVETLLARERELLFQYKEHWLASALPFKNRPGGHFELHGPYFRRGVPEVVGLSLDVWLQDGEALLKAFPTIREVAVFDLQGRGAELAQSALLERVDILEIADWALEPDAEALLDSPYFRSRPIVRVWEGSDSDWDSLWFVSPEGWPSNMRLEVVEFGGIAACKPGFFYKEVDELVQLFAKTGRTLQPLRPALDRFPLRPDQGQNLHPGQFGDGRFVLVGHGIDEREPLTFAFFDRDGNYLSSERPPDPLGCAYYEDYPPWLAKEYGYRPCLIWMREFQTPFGLGIELFPRWYVTDFVEQPDRRTADKSKRTLESTGELWSWLYHGSYVIHWCNTPWASRRSGEITDT